MFSALEMAPPDAIMGLTDVFKADPNPNKINLTVGVYKDNQGKTPVMRAVKKAEQRILVEELTKSYLSIEGSTEAAEAVQSLLFGKHEIVANRRAATAHTPGGTGALRVAADFVRQNIGPVTVWISDPTWPNHAGIFDAAGLPVKTYPYYDAVSKRLDFDAMLAALKTVPEGDLVLLHGCCHNPSGMDPDLEQWKVLALLAAERNFTPFFDFAYQGLGDGLHEDTLGMRQFYREGCELIIANSFSKNFGLYNERVGALTLVAQTAKNRDAALSQLKRCIRSNYSNPPAHGGHIVTTILGDAQLRQEWESELKEMCERIHRMRRLFVDTLRQKGVNQDFSFLTKQRGMFSFSGLTKQQVERLRSEHSVYMVGNGRMNVAGMTEHNIPPLCDAIRAVLEG